MDCKKSKVHQQCLVQPTYMSDKLRCEFFIWVFQGSLFEPIGRLSPKEINDIGGGGSLKQWKWKFSSSSFMSVGVFGETLNIEQLDDLETNECWSNSN